MSYGKESNIDGLVNKGLQRIQHNEISQADNSQHVTTLPAHHPEQTGGWAILKQAMVNQLPKKDVFTIVLMSVAKAFIDTNTKEISDEDRNYLVNELTDNIIKHYPSIRLNEIPDAIWKGVRGRFGEFYGLSVVTFERFIEQHLLSERRTRLVKEMPADEPAKTEPSLEQQFETGLYNVRQALQRKKDKKCLSTISTSVYNFLDRLGLMNYSTAEKYDMLADATRELIDELKFKLMLARDIERADIKKDIAAYKEAITAHAPVSTRLSTIAKMRAKKLVLDAFLNNLAIEEKDLEQMIESRKAIFLAVD